MADFYSGYTTPPSGGPGYRIHLVVNPGTPNIANNTTPLSWAAYLEMAYSWGGFYAYNSSSGSFVINGTTVLSIPSSTPSSAWDVSLYLGGGTITVPHNADGTKTVSVSGSFNGGNSGYAPGGMSFSSSMTLATIPRATTPTVSPTSGNTGATYAIGHTPATSSFVHDVAYSLDGGGSWTNIATNVAGTTTSTNWTPAHSLLPNSDSVTAIIRLTTKQSSGGATIGSPQTVNLPLTVPTSVKPTVSAVTWADAQTSSPNMPSLMGGAGRLVQGWSKLLPTVTAAGASGSTVTSRTATVGAQTTTSGVAFANPVSQSGSVPYSAVATDSRGRSSDPFTGNVTVKAYNFPNLPTPSVVRTSDAAGNTPSPTGTYLAITPAASVSSLNFSGEKNLIEYRIRTKPVGGSFTMVQDWTSSGTAGTTWTTKRVAAGPYAASNEYIVEVSIRDLFGKNGFNTGSTVITREVLVQSESVAFDWDQGEGLGINKYRQAGYALDVAGNTRLGGTLEVSGNLDIGGVGTQNRGSGPKRLLDVDDLLTDSNKAAPLVTGDWNNVLTTGWFRGNGLANNPAGSGWLFVEVIRHDSSWVTQVAYRYGTTQSWVRSRDSGTWTAWEQFAGDGRGYMPRQVVKFTSNGTFSKASYSWLRAIRVRVQAGGGGGGSSAAASGAYNSFGQGGGGGGYAESFITDIAGLASSVTVTVGAGGAANGNGGASSFGALVAASGGTGGSTKPNSPYTAYVPGGAGGIGTAGDILVGGSGGGCGAGDAYGLCASGAGGGSALGGGGNTVGSGGGAASVAGVPGRNYGGGGGGATTNGSGSGATGGSGAPGIVIVELFG